jgi:hypothetical protein
MSKLIVCGGMLKSLRIEIAVGEAVNTTVQGSLLEQLIGEVLGILQHRVEANVRITGMEVDLLAEHVMSKEKIYVECKAYTSTNVSADTFTKLLGNVIARQVSSGWLFSTGELGKDAKGFIEDWSTKPDELRKKLLVYRSDDIVRILISTGRVISPEKISLPDGYRFTDEAILIVSELGRFWAIPTMHSVAGVWQNVGYFHIDTGLVVNEQNVLDQLSKIKSTVAELLPIETTRFAIKNFQPAADVIATEFENIVAVPVAERWSDYRPARADDFVGRTDEQELLFDFLDSVRLANTKNRLLATKAPSGWGKSSFLNKLVARCNGKRSNRVFIYAVDCRTAVSGRYAELALKKCFDQAIASQFISAGLEKVKIGGASTPFSDISTHEILQTLKLEKKVLVLFFDQFEEITSKVELEDLFKSIQSLCFAVDAAQENVVLGFSWKTDGTVPQDHPAYHTWHTLADRRFEIELSRFTSTEISQALTRFSKEIGQQINAPIRRLLADHCQGYPWLLKKLCIHIFAALQKKNVDQIAILNKALNVQELFRRDTAELSAPELGCLKMIAAESPAEFFQIENKFGGDVIRRLIDLRLVIRSASKLILYWDIFRDYVLTGRVPPITSRYLPKINVGRTKVAIEHLLQSSAHKSNSGRLEKKLKISPGSADNVARDLLMLGIAEYSRKDGKLELIQNTEYETIEAIHRFLTSHVITKTLVSKFGVGFKINSDILPKVFSETYPDSDFAGNTWITYSNVFVAWLNAFRIVSVRQYEVEHLQDSRLPKTLAEISAVTRNFKLTFIGQAPPARVLETVARLLSDEQMTAQDRNSISVLRTIGLVDSTSHPVLLSFPGEYSIIQWIATIAFAQSTIQLTWDAIEKDQLSYLDVGRLVEKIRGNELSESSRLRYGNSIVVWHKWIKAILNGEPTV